MMSGAVLDLANLTSHLSPAPNTVGKHLLLSLSYLEQLCTALDLSHTWLKVTRRHPLAPDARPAPGCSVGSHR